MTTPRSDITGTEHDDLCEWCNEPLTEENVTEGDLGFYCSRHCLDAAEDMRVPLDREDFHSDG